MKLIPFLCLAALIAVSACQTPMQYFKNIAPDAGHRQTVSVDAIRTARVVRDILQRNDFTIKEDAVLPNGQLSIIAEHLSTELFETLAPYPTGYIRVLIAAETDTESSFSVVFKTLYRKSYAAKNRRESDRGQAQFVKELTFRLETLAR